MRQPHAHYPASERVSTDGLSASASHLLGVTQCLGETRRKDELGYPRATDGLPFFREVSSLSRALALSSQSPPYDTVDGACPARSADLPLDLTDLIHTRRYLYDTNHSRPMQMGPSGVCVLRCT